MNEAVRYRERFSQRQGTGSLESTPALAASAVVKPLSLTGLRSAMLSQKVIPRRERLIFALDVADMAAARSLIEKLGDSVQFYKIGLQLFMAGGYYDLLEDLTKDGKKVFVDLKFFDVPETVASAVSQLRGRGAYFASVHAGNDEILRAAVRARGNTKILAVTVLTSLDQHDLDDLGFKADINDVVYSRAKRALEVGCDGIISSGLEAEQLRGQLGHNFLIVTPGIRPVHNDEIRDDDQKRIATVEEAFEKGADYIVVGRPIRTAPDPRIAAEDIQARIAKLFAA